MLLKSLRYIFVFIKYLHYLNLYIYFVYAVSNLGYLELGANGAPLKKNVLTKKKKVFTT